LNVFPGAAGAPEVPSGIRPDKPPRMKADASAMNPTNCMEFSEHIVCPLFGGRRTCTLKVMAGEQTGRCHLPRRNHSNVGNEGNLRWPADIWVRNILRSELRTQN